MVKNKPFAENRRRVEGVPGVLQLLHLCLEGRNPLCGGVPLNGLSSCDQHLQLDLLLLPSRQQSLEQQTGQNRWAVLWSFTETFCTSSLIIRLSRTLLSVVGAQ